MNPELQVWVSYAIAFLVPAAIIVGVVLLVVSRGK